MIEVNADMKPVAYAWPGGYQMFYLARHGWRDAETNELDFNDHDHSESVLCPKCAGEAAKNDDILVAADINYEDNDLVCEQCNEFIPASYVDDNEDNAE